MKTHAAAELFLWFFGTFIHEMGERCIIKYALCTRKNNYNDFDIKAVRFYVVSISAHDTFAQKQVHVKDFRKLSLHLMKP